MDDIDYQALFMSLPEPQMVLRADDPLFTLVAENEAHARLINPATLTYSVGKPLLVAYPDTSEDYKRTGKSILVESIRRVVRTGQPDSMPDIRYDLADHSGVFHERWWRATHYPIKDAKGRVTQIRQITQDITGELLSQKRLNQTRAQLDLALSVGLVSSFNWDIVQDCVIGDTNLAKMFGVPVKEAEEGLPIQKFIDSIYADDRERVNQAIRLTIETNAPYEIEYRTIHSDHTVSWVIARGSLQKNDFGEPQNFIGILIDITARKEAERELETVKKMFDALFESTIFSVALADTDGKVHQANRTFLRTFGYTKKDLAKGLNSSTLTAIGSQVVTREIYDTIKEKGEARPVEKQYVRKDGSTFTGLVGAVRIPNEKNLFMAFILDVSENRRLKEINAAKDEFIALASHQLRTPATAVKQYLGIILEGFAGTIDDSQRSFLQTAYDSNERELQIINDLLKTAQLDTRGYEMTPQQTDIITLLDDIIVGITPVCDQKGQTIKFMHDPAIIARVDEDDTRIVLSNLIENAHKYSHQGSTIFVNASIAGESVSITVRDQGVGIAPKDIDAIFEKFTRVDNPLSDVSGGSGLGLYWVKRIVALHGGRLDVASDIGKGTTFMVELPL